MFRTPRRISDLETQVAALALAVAELRQATAAQGSAALKARIDECEQAIDFLRASTRREFGRLWHRFRSDPQPENGKTGDADIDALIELQRAPPVKPS